MSNVTSEYCIHSDHLYQLPDTSQQPPTSNNSYQRSNHNTSYHNSTRILFSHSQATLENFKTFNPSIPLNNTSLNKSLTPPTTSQSIQRGFIASIVTSDLPPCKAKAWVVEGLKGQQINLTLFDFSLKPNQPKKYKNSSNNQYNFLERNRFFVNNVKLKKNRQIGNLRYKRALGTHKKSNFNFRNEKNNLIVSHQNSQPKFYSTLLNSLPFKNKTNHKLAKAKKIRKQRNKRFDSTSNIFATRRLSSNPIKQCQQYLVVEDGSKNISVCGGGVDRVAWSYITQNHQVKIWVTAGSARNDLSRFLLQFQGR